MNVTRESFGECMNAARRFERLGKNAEAVKAALEAKQIFEEHPKMVENMTETLKADIERLTNLDTKMQTWAKKSSAVAAAAKAGLVAAEILKNDEGRFYFETSNLVSDLLDVRHIIAKAMDEFNGGRDERSAIAHDLTAAELVEAKRALMRADDALFASNVLDKKAAKKPKNAKENPGMYAGERRSYPKRDGVTKQRWDLLCNLWAEANNDTNWLLSSDEITAICEAHSWNRPSFVCDYRSWRMYHNVAQGVRVTKAIAAYDNVADPVVVSQDDVEVTEV